jgi:cytochrome P450
LVTIFNTAKYISVNENPVVEAARIDFGGEVPPIYGFCYQKQPTLVISDPLLLEQLYVQKNKYFDKHPRIYDMLKPCLGDSILLMRSNELWSAKRKSLSTAFYKDKLGKMMNIIREVVTSFVKQIEKDYIKTGTPFNLA